MIPLTHCATLFYNNFVKETIKSHTSIILLSISINITSQHGSVPYHLNYFAYRKKSNSSYYSNINVIYLVDQMLHVIFHGLLYSLYHPEELCPPKKKVTNLARYTFLTFLVRPRVFFQITFKNSAF